MPRPKQVAQKAGGGTGYTQPIEEAQEQAASAASHATTLRKQLEGLDANEPRHVLPTSKYTPPSTAPTVREFKQVPTLVAALKFNLG